MIRLPIGTKRASENTVKTLISIGALYVNETGIHANEPGIYPKKEEIPHRPQIQVGMNSRNN